jgi:DNA-binding protein H-NS
MHIMKSLVELQSEIESLTEQAKELRAKEYDRTIADIVSTMNAFGITLAVLRDAMKNGVKAKGKRDRKAKGAKRGPKPKAAAKVKAKAKGAKVRKPAEIKYRGPGGETWSGRGKQPKWLSALVANGHTAAEYKI